MTGSLKAIHVAARHGDDPQPAEQAHLKVGVGLEGDRYAGADGGVVSLIEAEQIDHFNSATGLDVHAAATRRNLLTEGVDLNALVGRRFRVGEVELEGFELCDPCAVLGGLLASGRVDTAAVVRAFAERAGLRARVISDGTIKPGVPIEVGS